MGITTFIGQGKTVRHIGRQKTISQPIPNCAGSVRYILMSGVLLVLALCSATSAWACEDWLAKTVAASGAAEHKSATADWQPLQIEQTICPGDSVRIGANSRAALHLRNNTFMRLDENSVVNFPAPKAATGFWLDLSQGVAHFISRIVNHFEVSTPYVNAVVEGTEFVVSATPAQASVAVLEGKVKTWNDAGTESVTSGQQVQASSRNGALTRINVASATTVEWAIHYPPVLTLQNLHAQDATEQTRLNELTPFLQQNRPDLALQALEQNPSQFPALATARAALLLTVGRVDDFDARIASLLQGPQAGPAHALKAVADAARNRPEPALASAGKAVELEPQQAAGYLALSWAQQSALQLDKALTSAKKAAQLEPENTLAWLRVSELHLMQGDTGAAQKALSHVKQNSADSAALQAQVLSARGFVNLFRLHIKTARKNFEDALQQDSADPQHHLGLGLALLRDGKLEDGRRQLEYAVSLDPLRSTLRSYLGRAYFEEKRDGEAIKQWDLAKQFDPNDPTPYFYTGVHKLFANDPVGAIDELETSKTLNDKRAIYRSETLLQSDAASRSATLARAYNEVGYDQGVLLNGWDAIRRDPTNAEGHRLLADHYLGDSRYESARASELLQSQLWQPLSAYPLQPQLSETGIAVVEGSGPQRPGFNEYHSLFTQDGTYGMANGYGGSDGTWGDDLVGSFLAGPMAVSLGQYHFESDGWRENADQEQDVYSGFVQWQVSPSTSVQFESRKFEWDYGDLGLHFSGHADESKRSDLIRETHRIGLTHRTDSAGAFLVSAARQKVTDRMDFMPDPDTTYVFDSKADPETLELQYVRRMSGRHVVTGVGVYSNNQVVDVVGASLGDIYFMQTDNQDFRHFNGYIYYSADIADSVIINTGLAYDKVRNDAEETIDMLGTVEKMSSLSEDEHWSPKLGLVLQAFENWFFRVATFKTFQRELAYFQTVEPTQFTGFNQIYDDADRAEATNYATALDGKLWGGTDVGFSYLARDVDYMVDVGGDEQEFSNRDEQIQVRLSQTLTNHVAASLSYTVDDSQFERPADADELLELVTHQIPLGVHVFLGSRYQINAQVAYVDQRARMQLIDADTLIAYADEFRSSAWVSNISAVVKFSCRCGDFRVGVDNLAGEDVQMAGVDASTLLYYPSRLAYGAVRLSF